eukprot:4521566-Heterocapsa_arctica.AAC.1
MLFGRGRQSACVECAACQPGHALNDCSVPGFLCFCLRRGGSGRRCAGGHRVARWCGGELRRMREARR